MLISVFTGVSKVEYCFFKRKSTLGSRKLYLGQVGNL